MLKSRGVLRNGVSSKEFFEQVAVNSGVPDVQVVKDVFYGMIKTISRELRTQHIINMPDWGKFYLKLLKSRNSRDIQTREVSKIPSKLVVKFSPDYKVRKYFDSFSKDFFEPKEGL